MMRKLILIVAVAALLPTAAHATRWVLIAQNDTAARYIDADAIVRDDAVSTIWLKIDYAVQGKDGETRAIEKWMHDCANARAKLIALTLYKPNGKAIGSAELPRYRLDWATIVPSSVGEQIHQRVCSLAGDDLR